MLATLAPVFDDKMFVSAYIVYADRENLFNIPIHMGTGALDGAASVSEFEIVNSVGIEGLSGNKEIFVPVTSISMYADLKSQCKVKRSMVVLLLGDDVEPTEENIARIQELKSMGFKIAFREIPPIKFAPYRVIFKEIDVLFLDCHNKHMQSTRKSVERYFPDARILVSNIQSQEDYDELKKDGPSDLYQGDFFQMPIENADKQLSPLKTTYVQLLSIVNQPDYDLPQAAKVIERDAALVVSLMGMVNRMTLNSGIKSVQHAASMLGQKELKRWINTAVTKELCADKPSEIMRLSMIRARFCENLSTMFDLEAKKDELFLAGMFSCIDIMLDKPMAEALEMVKVSKPIVDALVNHSGPFAEVLQYIEAYEKANWSEISRLLTVKGLNQDVVYKAYIDALNWYRGIIPA